MPRARDPEDVAATIQRSIEVSPKGSRRVRCHRLRDLFGFRAWTVQRKDSDLRKLLCETLGWFAELLIFPPKEVPIYGPTAESSSLRSTSG